MIRTSHLGVGAICYDLKESHHMHNIKVEPHDEGYFGYFCLCVCGLCKEDA